MKILKFLIFLNFLEKYKKVLFFKKLNIKIFPIIIEKKLKYTSLFFIDIWLVLYMFILENINKFWFLKHLFYNTYVVFFKIF